MGGPAGCGDVVVCVCVPFCPRVPRKKANALFYPTPSPSPSNTTRRKQVARAVFDERMPTPNQLFVARDDVAVTADDLLSTRGLGGGFSEADVRLNLNIALTYMESWLR